MLKRRHMRELKSKRDRLRSELKAKEKHGASRSQIKQLRRQVKDAEAEYEATGRPGKRAGVAAHLQ